MANDPMEIPYGTLVRFTRKNGESGIGVLKLIWMCLDAWCFDIIQMDATRIGVFPELGDEVMVNG